MAIGTPTADQLEPANTRQAAPPARREVLALALVCYALYVVVIALLGNYRATVDTFGDNRPYTEISAAIRHWDFSNIRAKQFWGLPYAMAGLSTVTGMSDWAALLTLSLLPSLIAALVAYKLWGGWVAGFFAVLSREWMERSLLGGAEPLFLALLFAAFMAARKERWLLASLLASLSTVVRPMGIFALAGIGLTLFLQREYRKLLLATLISSAIGVLYVLPLALYLGSPMANVKGYDQADWNAGTPLGVPLVAIIQDAMAGRATKLNLARTLLWMAFVLASATAMLVTKSFRAYARQVPVEAVFCGLYLVLLFTYNSSWARAEFPRFAIPMVPFSLLALERWIPKRRWVLWVFGLGSAALAAASTLGFVHSLAIIRRAL
jgi:hypothetical protein